MKPARRPVRRGDSTGCWCCRRAARPGGGVMRLTMNCSPIRSPTATTSGVASPSRRMMARACAAWSEAKTPSSCRWLAGSARGAAALAPANRGETTRRAAAACGSLLRLLAGAAAGRTKAPSRPASSQTAASSTARLARCPSAGQSGAGSRRGKSWAGRRKVIMSAGKGAMPGAEPARRRTHDSRPLLRFDDALSYSPWLPGRAGVIAGGAVSGSRKRQRPPKWP